MSVKPNAEQTAAAAALRGKVLISAGAGSGKTRTLVARYINALEPSPDEQWDSVPVDGVLAITFTEKAAGEIAERVRAELRATGRFRDARETDKSWIGTIHAFCSRVLRRYALEAGVDPAFTVADTVESERLKEAAFELACSQQAATAAGVLLDDFEFDAVFSAVTALDDHLRTRDIALESLTAEQARPAHNLLREAITVLTEGREAVRACGDERADATKLLTTCCSTTEMLEAIDGTGLGEPEVALEVWRALAGFKPSGRAASVKEIAATLKEHREQLLAQAATAAVSPHVHELMGLTAAYHDAYRTLKRGRGLLDFDDLQIETLSLLATNTEALDALRERLVMVMVDEFQDTDELQLALVTAVAGENLCTVGDEQQSIYGFRGADIAVYRRHNDEMRRAGAREFELRLNYRSHPSVLAFANHVFGRLFGDSLIRLEAGREESYPVLPEATPRVDLTFVRAGRIDGQHVSGRLREAWQVAESFAELRDTHGMDPGDMVVLLRSYTHADKYAAALAERGFSVSVIGGSRFFGVPSVVVGRCLLETIANPRDDEALAALLASGAVGLSDDGLLGIGRTRTASGPCTLWEVLASCSAYLEPADSGRVAVLLDVIGRARSRVGSCGLSEVLLRAVEELSYDLTLLSGGDEGRLGFANLLKLAAMADSFERSAGTGPAAFVSYLNAKEQYGDHTVPASLVDEHNSTVRIMSIHASKGLEFPVVALPELGSSTRSNGAIAVWRHDGDAAIVAMRLPSDAAAGAPQGSGYSAQYRRIREDRKAAELEEAQRLFYVACTRAREVLVLTGSGSFTKPPDPDSAVPLDWLRAALEVDPQGQGVDGVRSLGACDYAVRAVSAAGWSPPDRSAEPLEPPAADLLPAEQLGTHSAPDAPHPDAAAPERMSYSDFSLYESCPQRFWASRVLRVRSMRTIGDRDPLSFGNTVHAALQLAAPGHPLEPERYGALARAFELPEEELPVFIQAVEAYLSSDTARELESYENVRREWPFGLPVDTEHGSFTLVGSIDAFGRSGADALIVDYKTGRSGEPAELRERYRLQASTYALAALGDGCSAVRVVFTRPQALDEQGRPQEVEFEFAASDRPIIEADLARRFHSIAQGEYPPLTAWDSHTCGQCPIAGGVCQVETGEGWQLALRER